MAIYLDHNATTALDDAVLQAMLPYMQQFAGNPSSVHRFGRMQRDAIEQARQQVAALAGARAEQVVFTSGGTESNNLLLRGVAQKLHELDSKRPDLRSNSQGSGLDSGLHSGQRRFAISAVEHMSIIEPAKMLSKSGLPVQIDYLPVDSDGKVDEQAIKDVITGDTTLVSVMTANNETGVIQDIPALIERANEATGGQRCFFHSDASQAAGKIVLDFRASGLHAMTLSAHKFYGPLGAGALIVDTDLPISALLYGGSQEHGLRAGTENIPAIVGFGMAAQLADEQLASRARHVRELRDSLETGLKQIETVHIFAEHAERLPNTVQFGVHGFDGETLLMQLDRRAIAVSSGSACTSGKGEPSHVHRAMGIADELASSSIRVSLGKTNTLSDVEGFLSALAEIIESNRQSAVMMAANI
jgi:cysteine desulfurase